MRGADAREEATAAMREQLVTSPPPPSEPEAEPEDGPMSDAAARQQQELQAEGNVVSACSIFAVAVVLDALNALPSTLVVDVPVSLRTTALVLITMAWRPITPNILVRQRSIASVLLAVTAWLGAHQGGVNARIADALYSLLCGWAVILIFGLRGPRPGERGYDSKGRRENVTALAAAFLHAGVRIVRAGFYHAPEVPQFTATHGDITARGYAMADDVVACARWSLRLPCVRVGDRAEQLRGHLRARLRAHLPRHGPPVGPDLHGRLRRADRACTPTSTR